MESIKRELFRIRSFELTTKSAFIVEKLLWMLIAISGIVWFCFFMAYQVNIWNNNKIIISKSNMDLSDVEYPAITFCSNKGYMHGVVDRLGNFIDPDKKVKNEFLAKIRKSLVKCAIKRNPPSLDLINDLAWVCPEFEYAIEYEEYDIFYDDIPDEVLDLCDLLIFIHECKSNSESIQMIYENILDYLSEEVAFSKWNIGKSTIEYLDSETKFPCDYDLPEEIDWNVMIENNTDMLTLLIQAIKAHHDDFEEFDWTSDNIGS